MITVTTNSPQVLLNPYHHTRSINKIGIVGSGEVVRERLWLAAQSLASPLDGIVVCSLEPHSGLPGLSHQYYQIGPESLLPLDRLDEAGFLGADTVWFVATPPAYHVSYVEQLAPRCRVAVEKPIATSYGQARSLLPFVEGFEVYPLNHKVFNASVLEFVEACRQDPAVLQQVHHITGVFYEKAGFSHGRQQEDGIIDVQWHLLTTALFAPFTVVGVQFKVTVDQVHVATHGPDPNGHYARPTVWTASQLQGRLVWDGHVVTYDLRQAKGAPQNAKGIRLFDHAGALVQAIDLNESGYQAHARMLRALLEPVVDMRLTLADAIAVMECIDTARAMVHEAPPYTCGYLPAFLCRSEVAQMALARAA
jgi:predicted dehydrogenase